MQSHIITSDKEKQLETAITEQLKQTRNAGMAIGAKSVSKVIYDKAMAENKTDSEKITDIIEFCKIGLNIKT